MRHRNRIVSLRHCTPIEKSVNRQCAVAGNLLVAPGMACRAQARDQATHPGFDAGTVSREVFASYPSCCGVKCCGLTSGEWMGYIPDLAQTGPVISVGYLSREHDYPKGETSEAVFDRLGSLVLLHLVSWLGYHDCELASCGLNQPPPELYWRGMRIPRSCSSDIVVPDGTVVYMAPALILHYIRVHQYLPPARFLKAVLNCPEPGSDEYHGAINKIVPDYGLVRMHLNSIHKP